MLLFWGFCTLGNAPCRHPSILQIFSQKSFSQGGLSSSPSLKISNLLLYITCSYFFAFTVYTPPLHITLLGTSFMAPCLVLCSAITILKFFIICEQGALHLQIMQPVLSLLIFSIAWLSSLLKAEYYYFIECIGHILFMNHTFMDTQIATSFWLL